MAPEVIALRASISFALFAIYGWLGLNYSTPVELNHFGVFFRGKEQITVKTVLGTIAVVGGPLPSLWANSSLESYLDSASALGVSVS